jgi:hypothetical protein
MGEAGRSAVDIAVDKMHGDGNTNLWSGLEAAMDLLRNSGATSQPHTCRTQTILLFTDGVPTFDPPHHALLHEQPSSYSKTQSHVVALQAYFAAHPGFHCDIRTFGFGYNIDSDLLLQVRHFGAPRTNPSNLLHVRPHSSPPS